MKADRDEAVRIFTLASEYVRQAGLCAEVEWQRRVALDTFTETELLREAAWVILCSGFREATVRRCFNYVSLCFCDWESASSIVDASSICKLAARSAFRNEAKLDAIVGVATCIDYIGFQAFKKAVVADPIKELRRLPYIGSTTVWHLAKNLGLNAAKPDRHLVRVSEHLGFSGADTFCSAISEVVGEEPKVVDLIVWRYLADNPVLRREWA
jgi:hypothetical protein